MSYILQQASDDLMSEIKKRAEKNERVLVTTLTKKMAESLSSFLIDKGVKCKYLHSDIDTLERVQIIRELRQGKFTHICQITASEREIMLRCARVAQ